MVKLLCEVAAFGCFTTASWMVGPELGLAMLGLTFLNFAYPNIGGR